MAQITGLPSKTGADYSHGRPNCNAGAKAPQPGKIGRFWPVPGLHLAVRKRAQ